MKLFSAEVVRKSNVFKLELFYLNILLAFIGKNKNIFLVLQGHPFNFVVSDVKIKPIEVKFDQLKLICSF